MTTSAGASARAPSSSTRRPPTRAPASFPLPADDAQYGYTYPVAAYDHDPGADWNCRSDVGRAIAGGFVYRGKDAPALRGKYIFGDLVDGRILAADTRDMRRGGDLAPLEQLMLFDRSTGEDGHHARPRR